MMDDLAFALVGGMRAFAGLSSLIGAVVFADCLPRLWRRAGLPGDWGRFWLMALLTGQIGFILYWLTLGRDNLAPAPALDLLTWASCYAVLGVAAQGLVFSVPAPALIAAGEAPLSRRLVWAAAGLWTSIACVSVGVSWLVA
jgi:hypothetical protein